MPDPVIIEGPFRTRRKAQKRERVWQLALSQGFASDRLPEWANGVKVGRIPPARKVPFAAQWVLLATERVGH